jgi:hypothetical protein
MQQKSYEAPFNTIHITIVVHDLSTNISYYSLLATIRLWFSLREKPFETGSKTASNLTHSSLLGFPFHFDYLLVNRNEKPKRQGSLCYPRASACKLDVRCKSKWRNSQYTVELVSFNPNPQK